MLFRLWSRLRRRRPVVESTSMESELDRGVRSEDALLEPRVCGHVRRVVSHMCDMDMAKKGREAGKGHFRL